MTSTDQPLPEKAAPDLAKTVGSAISRLQAQILTTEGPRSIRGTMAALRSGIGKPPELAPKAWSTVIEDLIQDFPEKWLRSDVPSPQEKAAYTAMTHWALHQQSMKVPAHVVGNDLGYAIGRLAAARDSKSIKSRFDALLVNPSEGAFLTHLRSLIQLLRDAQIPLDYGKLATSIATMSYPDGKRKVVLVWGRSFARGLYHKPSDTAEKN